MPTRALPKTAGVNPKASRASVTLACAFALVACTLALLLSSPAPAFAQSAQREAPATVEGRVTEGERGLAGVVVLLTPNDQPARSRGALRAKTDAEGRYLLTNVTPGRYQILPYAPAFVVEGLRGDFYPAGKPLLLTAGDTADNVDFRMERGGVITGRVTDDGGNPVVAMYVAVSSADNSNAGQQPVRASFTFSAARDQMTDDRGVYRIYGLRAGHYRVSAGSDEGNGAIGFGSRKVYRRTFYPDATDQAQAQVVEVSAGHETADVDIRLGSPLKTYKASGRFVEADTGRPVPNIPVGYGTLSPDGRHVASMGTVQTTNARGEFTVEGLASGHYAVFAFPFPVQSSAGDLGAPDLYSDPVNFDVADSDVAGLVVKLKRGSTLSGYVSVEGVADRATAARLASQLQLFAYYAATNQPMMPGTNSVRPVPVAADGSFTFAGLRPGKIIVATSSQAKGVTLSRVELNGVNVSRGVDVSEGAQVTGLHVILKYGNATITGQVNFSNGALPQDARVFVIARPVGGETSAGGRTYPVDARGHFRIDSLAAGEYEVSAQGFSPSQPQPLRSDTQRVSVAEGGEATTTLTLEPAAPVRRVVRP